MFTLQVQNLEQGLIQAGMDPGQAMLFAQVFGNCAQTLDTRGPVVFNGPVTNTGAVTNLGPVTNGVPVTNNNTTNNTTNGPVTNNGTTTLNGPTTINGPITFNSTSNFGTTVTFNNVTNSYVAATMLGTVGSGVTISAGAVGLINVTDDQGVAQGIMPAVRALGTLVAGQAVQLFYSAMNREWYAVPLNVPLIAKATAAIAYQASGTVNILKSDKTNPPGGVLGVSAYAFYRQIAKNEFCLVWWDYYKQQFYAMPLNAMIFGQVLAGSYGGGIGAAKGATNVTIELFSDRFVDLSTTLTNCCALTDLIHYDYVQLFWDSTNNEFGAWALSRPLLGNPGSDIAQGSSGNVSLYDLNAVSLGVTVTGFAPTAKLLASVYALMFWDMKNVQWLAMPMPSVKQTFVTTVVWDGTLLKMKTRDVWCVPDSAESGFQTIDVPTTC
jgi:hypothetical protein